MRISPYESSFTPVLDIEARLQPIQSVSLGFADETMQALLATSALTEITGSSNSEEEAVRKRDFSPNRSHWYNHMLDTEAPSQPFPTAFSGIPSGTMQASPATSTFTAITDFSNELMQVSPATSTSTARDQGFSPSKSHSHTYVSHPELPSQPSLTIWPRIADGTMQALPAVSASTAITDSSVNEQRAVHGWDFTRNESQISCILQNGYPFSPDSLDTNGQTVDLTNDPTHNSHTLHIPVKPHANCPVYPSDEPFFDIPKDTSTLGPLPPPPGSPVSCEFCGQVINAGKYSQGNLKRHIVAKHVPPSNWKHKCKMPDCEKTFPRSDGLKIHYQTTHSSYPQLIHNRTRHRTRNPNNQ